MALNVGELYASLDLRTGGFDSGLQHMQKSMNSVAANIASVGKNLTAKVTAPIVGLFTASARKIMQFDDSMSRVQALTQATTDEFEAMRKQAKELGATTAWSASQAADGMGFLAQAGFEANDILQAMPSILATASAGQLELARTADIVSNVLSGFQIDVSETSRVADVLAKAQASANVNIEQLGESLKFAAPIAKEAGQSLEEMTAFIAKMGDAGVQGSMAGTSLRSALLRLSTGAGEAGVAIEKLNLQVTDENGNMRSLTDIVRQLEKRFEKMTQQQKLSYLEALFGKNAMTGMAAAMSVGSDELEKYTLELMNSKGAAQEMAAIMEDNLGGAFRNLKSALESFLLAIGEPQKERLQKLALWLADLLRAFNDLSPGMQQFASDMLIMVAAIGPILLIVAQLVKLFGFLMTPIGAVAGLLALLGGAFILAYNNSETFREKVKEAITKVREIVDKGLKKAGEFIKRFTDKAKENFNTFKERAKEIWDSTLKDILSDLWNNIKPIWELIKQIMEDIWEIIKMVWEQITDFWDKNGNQIMEATANIFGLILAIIGDIMNGILKVVNFFLPLVRDLFSSIFAAIELIVSGALDIILGIVKFFASVFTGDFQGMADGVEMIFRGMEKIIVGIVTGLADIVTSMINGAIEKINQLIKKLNTVKLPKFLGGGEINIPTIERLQTNYEVAQYNKARKGISVGSTEERIRTGNFNYIVQEQNISNASDAEKISTDISNSYNRTRRIGGSTR